MSALGDLSERLGKLAGPDREVDRLIHFHYVHPWLAEKAVKWAPAAFEPEGEFIWWTAERLAETGKEGYPDAWEPVTASLDASVALVEKMLPGWACGGDFGRQTKMAFVDPHDYSDRFRGAGYTATGPTPATIPRTHSARIAADCAGVSAPLVSEKARRS